MQRRAFLASIAAQSAAATLAARAATDGGADLLVHGATIHTVDDAQPAAEAFVVHGGRFVYVGTLAQARTLAGPRTRTLALDGATVLPGLIDAHLHLTQVGLALHEADLTHAASLDEMVRRVVAFAKQSPDGWLVGDGWDQNLWPDKRFPTREALDAAFPDRPVALWRVDGHALLANGAAMRAAHVDAATADVPGGKIVRDAAGAPTGLFIDNAYGLILNAMPAPSHEMRMKATTAATRECHRYGVTSVCEARTDAGDLAAFDELGAAGKLDLRLYALLESDDALLERAFAAGPRDAAYDGRLWVRAVKMYVDGALGSRGAALLAPYSDDPKNSGIIRTPPTRLRDVTALALAAGFQVGTHAIGDRANRMALDAYEAALQMHPIRDHRMRVEHAQILDPADVPRFKQLGVIPSMQATHQISDMPWAPARLGAERTRYAYAWRSLIDSGVIVPNGTDAPVEPVNSLRTFHASISRQNEANEPHGGWHPEQRMTRDEALRSMTIWAAHASFREHVIGSISTGKYADFVVMDRDWLTAAPEDIMQTKILATYFNGTRVYDAATASNAPSMSVATARRRAACCTHAA